jgi:hypothetical protein
MAMRRTYGESTRGGVHGFADSMAEVVKSCALVEILHVSFVDASRKVQSKLMPLFPCFT